MDNELFWKCGQCSGNGWYMFGHTDAPEQRQCDECCGVGYKPVDMELMERALIIENDRAVKQALKNYADKTPANPDNGAMWETCFRSILLGII